MKLSLGKYLFNSRFGALFCLPACALTMAMAQQPPTSGNAQNQSQLPAASGSVTYTVTDLGTLPGCDIERASAINDLGQVIGDSSTGCNPFLWQNGKLTDLGRLPGDDYGYAMAINNKGQVVGYAGNSAGANKPHAFLWQNGLMTDLGTLNDGGFSEALGINDKGQVTGYSTSSADAFTHALLWQNGRVTELGILGVASAIDNEGQIAGFTTPGAFLWQDGKTTEIRPYQEDLYPTAINDKGQAVGYSYTSVSEDAFLWQNGLKTYLGTLTGTVMYGCISQLQFIGCRYQQSGPGSRLVKHSYRGANACFFMAQRSDGGSERSPARWLRLGADCRKRNK